MPAFAKQRESARYLPCLLTRLTDAHPFSAEDGDFYAACFSPEQLKQDILMNLDMLLNARTNPAETEHLRQRFPEVAYSAYHFGIDSITGVSRSSLHPTQLAEIVRRALVTFEPRLQADSVSVVPDMARRADKTVVHLDITSRLAVHPLTQDVYFRLRVDMETGEIGLSE